MSNKVVEKGFDVVFWREHNNGHLEHLLSLQDLRAQSNKELVEKLNQALPLFLGRRGNYLKVRSPNAPLSQYWDASPYPEKNGKQYISHLYGFSICCPSLIFSRYYDTLMNTVAEETRDNLPECTSDTKTLIEILNNKVVPLLEQISNRVVL